jgi:hypothetical protein
MKDFTEIVKWYRGPISKTYSTFGSINYGPTGISQRFHIATHLQRQWKFVIQPFDQPVFEMLLNDFFKGYSFTEPFLFEDKSENVIHYSYTEESCVYLKTNNTYGNIRFTTNKLYLQIYYKEADQYYLANRIIVEDDEIKVNENPDLFEVSLIYGVDGSTLLLNWGYRWEEVLGIGNPVNFSAAVPDVGVNYVVGQGIIGSTFILYRVYGKFRERIKHVYDCIVYKNGSVLEEDQYTLYADDGILYVPELAYGDVVGVTAKFKFEVYLDSTNLEFTSLTPGELGVWDSVNLVLKEKIYTDWHYGQY